jgi:7-carboxy-7-deazaguanine synthase
VGLRATFLHPVVLHCSDDGMDQSSMLRVTEIFHSIQGESSFAGQPCVFVRLTGCPLRCTWCDSEYAFYGGSAMAIEEIAAKVRGYGCRLVEVTGGEPLHQPDAISLVQRLCEDGHQVLVETSGAVDISGVDARAHVIMDVKCPGSGMVERMRWDNLKLLRSKDEAKFVIKDRADYDWACSIVKQYDLATQCQVLFGPVFGQLELRQLAEWILADGLPVRLQMQLHKYIWDPNMTGV